MSCLVLPKTGVVLFIALRNQRTSANQVIGAAGRKKTLNGLHFFATFLTL